MNCREFEALGLDSKRDSTLGAELQNAAQKHALNCSRCASLQASWEMAQAELRVYGDATGDVQAPPRVEMRLLQEFHTRHTTVKARNAAVLVGWALAAAAALIAMVSWWSWQNSRQPLAKIVAPEENVSRGGGTSQQETLIANSGNDFTPLPGSLGFETDGDAVVRVRMQRAGLGALGLPVNEERAGEWIQVDLLVGSDGWPQGVRFAK